MSETLSRYRRRLQWELDLSIGDTHTHTSLRVLLPCVRVGAFVCAYLMLTLIWTVGSHFFSLIIIFLPSFFEL